MKDSSTIFCFPTKAEAEIFSALRPDADVREIGVGMASAGALAAIWIAALGPKRIVLCGIAGACDERLQVGRVVEVVSDAVAGLPEAYAKEYTAKTTGKLPQVNTLTVSHTGDALPYIPQEASLPYVEQMEGAGVAAACEELNVEFYHIRVISNRVGDDRSKWCIKEAVTALGTVVAQLF